jgi:hypothetical protein
MPTSRLWAAHLLAVAGLVLVTAAGGAILSGSAPTKTPDWYRADGGAAARPAVIAVTGSGAPAAAPATGAAPQSSAQSVAAVGADSVRGTDSSPGAESAAGAAVPPISPSPAVHLWIPAIAVDAQVLPVDSMPTGARNPWGGEVFAPIDFPVDRYVRQWARRGDPNSVPAAESRSDVKAFDRTVLYGHASDIGNHLIFQDLSALQAGDSITVDTALGRFVYAVTGVASRAKSNLDDMAALYDYPADGRKELALVACLPDTTSNIVVFATLVTAQVLPD